MQRIEISGIVVTAVFGADYLADFNLAQPDIRFAAVGSMCQYCFQCENSLVTALPELNSRRPRLRAFAKALLA